MILHKDAFIKTLSGDALIINQDLKWLLVAIFEFVTWITLYLIVPELFNTSYLADSYTEHWYLDKKFALAGELG